MSYFGYQVERAPPWLRGPKGADWARTQGDVKDSLARQAIAGVEQRFPTLATTGALTALASERGMLRGPNEAVEVWAGRIRSAWELWQSAGTALGLLLALRAAGYSSVTLAQVRERLYTLDGDGNLVTTELAYSWRCSADQTDSFWSKFVVLFTGAPLPLGYAVGTLAEVVPVGYTLPVLAGGPIGAQDATELRLDVVGAGLPGVATFRASLDGGATWSSTVATNASSASPVDLVALLGIQGTLTVDWSGAHAPSLATLEADGLFYALLTSSDAMELVRLMVRSWKPSLATCDGLIVIHSGRVLGYPVRTLGPGNGTLGGNVAYKYPP